MTFDDLLDAVAAWEARFAAAGCAPADLQSKGGGFFRRDLTAEQMRQRVIAQLCRRGLTAAMTADMIGLLAQLDGRPAAVDILASQEACWSYETYDCGLPTLAHWRTAIEGLAAAGVAPAWGHVIDVMGDLLPIQDNPAVIDCDDDLPF